MGESTSFGKYRLIAELGHGGMADVFLAVQAGPEGSGFSKLTVVKRLRRNLAEEPEFVAMLVDEARIAARLNHPNVVQTNEVGEVDGQYFIAMEYLDGQPFHRIQHRATKAAATPSAHPLNKEHQYVIVMEALAGLHHAHELRDYDGTELGIVHRDVTPHNIFVSYEGQVKVVDFGIAKAAGRSSETRQGVVKGKVRYMAPEQAVGHDVDRRADVFAAGVILWEIAAGRRMWKDMDDLKIVQALVTGELPPGPRHFDETVPEALDKICVKALRPKAQDRYASAEEFRQDLEQFLIESGALLTARRGLNAVINELFADKRAEIRRVIEQQLSLINSSSKPSLEMRAVIAQDPPSSATPVSISVEEAEPATSLTDQKTEVYTGSSQRNRRMRSRKAPIVVAAAAALLCAGGLMAWRASASRTAALTGAIANDDVTVRITGNTPKAVVRVDDGPAQALPYEGKVHRDKRDHNLRFEADGFAPETKVVPFSDNLMMAVELVPIADPSKDKGGEAKDDAKKAKDNRQAAAAPTWAPPPKTTAAPAKTAEPPAPTTAPPPAPTPAPASSTAKTDKDKNGRRLVVDPNMPW
jgi:serine/threonine-protein kinase